MATPTSREFALQSEVQQLRERLALLEGRELQGRREGEAGLMGTHDEAAARKNRLEAVLEALPVGVALVDAQGGIIECNAAFEQTWGRPRPRSVGDYAARKPRWPGTGHPVRLEEWASSHALRKGETVVNQEVWIERFDGTRALVLNSAAPIRDVHGRICGCAVAIRDVTKLKETEAALHESEERFRTVADTAPVMIWMAGPDKLCTFFNKPWLEFTGRLMERELGNGWVEGVHPDDLDRCLKTYFSAFDARRSFQIEYRLRRADGEYRWLLDSGTPRYREGEFAGYIGSCIDITDKTLAEEQLRSNQAQLVDSQRLAKVGSWELNVATRSTRWSDEWYRIFGLSRDVQPDFETFLNSVHPKDRTIVMEAEKTSHSVGAPFEVEFRIIRSPGEVRFIRSIVEPIKNEEGALVRLAGAAQDITEQVKATERLRESEARLKNAERVANLGHWDWDLKTNSVLWSEGTYRIVDRPRDYQPSFEDLLRMTIPEDRERVEQVVRASLAQNRGFAIEFQIARPNGDRRTLRSVSEGPLNDEEGRPGRMFGTVQDITEEMRAQAESFARQKLESVVTLAGGVAHDFNNLLGSALAQAELGLGDLDAGLSPKEELAAIRDVAIRGSEIVRQADGLYRKRERGCRAA